jgi:hypothetical protein
LFQQQPTDLAGAPVLSSAFVLGCSWLHLDSASREEAIAGKMGFKKIKEEKTVKPSSVF